MPLPPGWKIWRGAHAPRFRRPCVEVRDVDKVSLKLGRAKLKTAKVLVGILISLRFEFQVLHFTLFLPALG